MKSSLAFTAVASLAVSASPALAQTTDGQRAGPPQTTGASQPGASAAVAQSSVSDIIVTANKRSERANDVGMSITAATGEALTRLGVTTPDQLSKITPGFVAVKSAWGTPVYTLRGVGFYDYSLNAVPAVTVYVDQIPMPYSQMSQFASLDVERVEVLKGPQGTLYGLNSTAGAINYIAAKPTKNFSAGLDLTAARFGAVDVSGYVSGPLSSDLRVRIAGMTEQGGAWQRSITRGESNGNRDRFAVRALFDWTPTSKFSALLSLMYGSDRSDSLAPQFVQIVPTQPINSLVRTGQPGLYNFPIASSDPRRVDYGASDDFSVSNDDAHASLTLSYDLGGSLTIKSLTSYQNFRADSAIDDDGTPFQDFDAFIDGKLKAFYQELALYGNGTSFNWIVGGNYIWDSVDDSALVKSSQSYLGGFGINGTDAILHQKSNTAAVFASGEYKLTSTLTALAGVRYTHLVRHYSGCATAIDAVGAATFSRSTGFPIAVGGCFTTLATGQPGLVNSRLEEENVAWRAGLNWKFAKNMLLYANVSRGYKSGAFPVISASRAFQLSPVTQERVMAYEFGTKLTLSNWLQFNAAAFYYDYKDKQVRGKLIDPNFGTASALVNVPQSRVYGAEAQIELSPYSGLSINISGTSVNSRILGNYSNFDFLGLAQRLSGEDLPFTPRFTGAVNTNYRFAVGNSLAADAGFVLTHASTSNSGLGALAIARIKPSTVLDLSASIGASNDHWRLRIWGRNVTDEYYWTATTFTLDTITRNTAPPVTYGATLQLRF